MRLIIFIFLVGCSHEHVGPANKHMHHSSHAELAKRFDDPKRDQQQKPDVVMSLLTPLREQVVIDIGVGSGYFAKHLLAAGAMVTGADVDDKFLEIVTKKFPQKDFPSFKTLKIDYDDPKMKEESYDVAFTSNTYHHIENRIAYLRKVKQGLKKSGRFVVFDYKKDADSKSGPPNWMRIDHEDVVGELKEAGFASIKLHTSEFEDHYLVIATK